ncbi:MAG: hypothetical protein WA919_13710 [Coleofasciculaceae cyanobacterium]
MNLINKGSLTQFLIFCSEIQPEAKEDIGRFFEGVIFFPYDNELLLQAFLFLNINKLLPNCRKLLLFEKSPVDGKSTNLGKCDFVYLLDNNHLLLIETKYIDVQSSGATERARRNKHRKKVFEQVIEWKDCFSQYWQIPSELIQCTVFTTDSDLRTRGEELNIATHSITIEELEQWRKQQKHELKGR